MFDFFQGAVSRVASASSNALLTFRTSSTRRSSAREKVDRPSLSLMWLVASETQCHECSTCRNHHLLRARGVLPRMPRTPTPGTTSLACCVHHHTDQPLCRLSRRKGSGWCCDSRCSHVCLKNLDRCKRTLTSCRCHIPSKVICASQNQNTSFTTM